MKSLAINPKFIVDKQGKKTEVVLNIKEFSSLIEELEDLYDTVKAEKIIAMGSKKYSLDTIKKSILKKN